MAERMGFEPMCDCSQTDFEFLSKRLKTGGFRLIETMFEQFVNEK